MRRSHCSWLNTEIKRLTSEAQAVQTTIPPIFMSELLEQEAHGLPASGYTGGVDDIAASSCPRCGEWRQEVLRLQRQARELDAQCKARIESGPQDLFLLRLRGASRGSEAGKRRRWRICSLPGPELKG